MGASNVAMVYTHWTHLGHREARLLAYLALVSLDAGTPPVYFGGWADAARAIGLDPEGNPESAREASRQAFQRLARAGALVSSGKAHSGRRAEYALTLDPARSAVATGTAAGPHGRAVTTWTVVDRATGRPVDKSPRIWQRGNDPLGQRGNDPLGHMGQRSIGERPNDSLPPRRKDDPHQEHGEEHIALEVSTGPAPASAGVRSAAVFLARQPDQGRAALADMMANRGSLSESDVVLIAARMAGWAPEAEEVPA